MAKAKMAVIGDKDSVMLFKAVGIDVFYETDGERPTGRSSSWLGRATG